MHGATDPMKTGTIEHATVVGRYELVGVNGGLLPVSLDPEASGSDMAGCSVLSGELRLETDGTYVLELSARYELPAGAGGVRTIASGGTWRFLPSVSTISSQDDATSAPRAAPMNRTWAGRVVVPSSSVVPSRSAAIARASGTPRTRTW